MSSKAGASKAGRKSGGAARAEEALIERFMRHGIQPTRQRLAVGRVMLTEPTHLCAEDVRTELRRRGMTVSKATVYNTLNLFVQQGLLREVVVEPYRVFYDSTTRPHHHIYDVDRSELHDLATDELRLERIPELPAGTELQGVDVVIRVHRRRKA